MLVEAVCLKKSKVSSREVAEGAFIRVARQKWILHERPIYFAIPMQEATLKMVSGRWQVSKSSMADRAADA